MNSVTKKVMAGAAALGLCLTIAACSNSESTSAGSSASSVASSAASEASSAASSAASVAQSAQSEAAAADADDNDADDDDAVSAQMTEVTTKDGTKQQIPAAIATVAAQRTDLKSQDPQTVVAEDGKYLVNYGTIAGGYQYNVAYTEETGAVEIYGEIFNAWREDGTFESKVGAPKAPEVKIDNGFSQEFTDGTITWTTQDGKAFAATVTENED